MATLLEHADALWQYLRSDELLFWALVGGVIVLILLLLSAIRRGAKRRRERSLNSAAADAQVFVSIDAEKDTEDIFLPLADKLEAEAALYDKVSADILLKIRDNKPQCLEEIMQVWPRLRPPYQADLRQIIAQEQLLLLYLRNLGEPDYHPSTLAIAWRECPEPTLLPEFVELLASRQEAVQMAGVQLLTELNDPQLLTYLASAILQPQRYVPARVADVLIAIGEPAALLLVYLLGEIPGESKPPVLSVLGKIPATYPLEKIEACLSDPLEQTRRAAATALGELGAHSSLAALCLAAFDEDWSVRAAIAKSLGQIGDPAVIPILQKLSADKNWTVEANAREALRLLEAQDKTG